MDVVKMTIGNMDVGYSSSSFLLSLLFAVCVVLDVDIIIEMVDILNL